MIIARHCSPATRGPAYPERIVAVGTSCAGKTTTPYTPASDWTKLK
jgi:hypothetical protein